MRAGSGRCHGALEPQGICSVMTRSQPVISTAPRTRSGAPVSVCRRTAWWSLATKSSGSGVVVIEVGGDEVVAGVDRSGVLGQPSRASEVAGLVEFVEVGPWSRFDQPGEV